MSAFLYDNHQKYVCNTCMKKCEQYSIFTNIQMYSCSQNNIQDVLDRFKKEFSSLQFYCNECFKKKILDSQIVKSTIFKLETQINKELQDNAEFKKQIADQNNQIEELNKRIEELKLQQKYMFSFQDIQNEYMEIETKINEFQDLFGQEIVQQKKEKLLELFNSHNVKGLLRTSKQLENFLESNINVTKENIKKIQTMNSQFLSISDDLVNQNVVSKSQMEEFIDQQIQNQNLDKKIQLYEEILQFQKKQHKEPQSQNTDNITQQ
ncbi:hypothetical protein OXYTRIMIC_324 [Oxytricha trifallax]|uniref:Uncharacterized protein n=1 Tax=Oxytricha trifallax TaxID=1172189 RepID=A0A073IAJ8_9SPIT|nr:hypothetical protein OXYTRIMIC_324 [Oxytricha trifallax]